MRLAAILAMFLVAPAAFAAEAGTSGLCPQAIDVVTQELAAPQEGWTSFSFSDTPYELDAIYIYTGMKKLSRLEPGKGTETFSEWRFEDKDRHYVVCSYTHTSIMLKKLLDEKITSCRMSYESKDGKQVKKINCK